MADEHRVAFAPPGRGGRGQRGGRGGRGQNLSRSTPQGNRGGGWTSGASGGIKRKSFAGKARLSAIFHEFDDDDSGFISAVELR